MHARSFLLLTLCAASCASAWAQWQWVADDGRKVFSDRPPPAHIPPQRILQQPRPAPLPVPVLQPENAAPIPSGAPGAANAAAIAGAPRTPANPQEAQRDAQARAKQLAAEKAALAQYERQRQENCQRAQSAQNVLSADIAMTEVNAQGQRTFMTPERRREQLDRAKAVVQTECGPQRASK